jgi:hypothetical protein
LSASKTDVVGVFAGWPPGVDGAVPPDVDGAVDVDSLAYPKKARVIPIPHNPSDFISAPFKVVNFREPGGGESGRQPVARAPSRNCREP